MDNRIKNAIESVAPDERQKRRMLGEIIRRAEQNKEETEMTERKLSFRKPLRVALIAAAVGCMLAATVFAEEIGSLFSGFLTNDTIVSDSVATGVFSDSDGHVEMTVEELLTDRAVIRAVIHYRAIDDEGVQWLAGMDETKMGELAQERKLVAWSDKITSGCWSCEELSEYRTSGDIYYSLYADCEGRTAESVTLCYPMTADDRETELEMVKVVKAKVCAINPEQEVFTSGDCSFYPTEVELSPLSVSVYGKQNGIAYFEKYDNGGWGAYSLIDEETEIVSSLYLVRADGSKVELNGFASGLRQQSSSMGYESEDYIFCHYAFVEPVDISEYTGIEFNGEYFPFVEE